MSEPLFKKTYSLEKLEEDRVWQEDLAIFFKPLSKNVFQIWSYAFTEILNNAIDHSEGSEVTIILKQEEQKKILIIADNGIGIFKKISSSLNLYDELDAALELIKGKLTTAKKHHSGEGIFFCSRMIDQFNIFSGSLTYRHDSLENEYWFNVDKKDSLPGTFVTMRLSDQSLREMQPIFDQFSDDEFSFAKTVIPLHLAQYGDQSLVSRSQAKRILNRVEQFKVIILDFKDVEMIGQGFADQIFRVFQNDYPDIQLISINTEPDVEKMIQHVKRKSQ